MIKKLRCFANSLHGLLNYKLRKTLLNNPPAFMWVEPTNKCNLKCIMCPNSVIPKEKSGFMQYELFKKIVDEAKDFIGAAFMFLGGESLLHKDIFKMIAYAKDNGIRPLLHTNATLLNEQNISQLFDAGLDYISLSIDGFNKETYEKVRVNAKYEVTLQNIINLLKIKKEKKLTKPYTVIQTLLTDYKNYIPNTEEEKEFYALFQGLPVDEINVRIPHAWGSNLFETDKYVPKSLGRVYSPCSFLWGSISILYDGTVVPCCIDFSGAYPLGNVKDRKILDIWNDEPMRRLRNAMLDRSYVEHNPLCKNCMYVWEPHVAGIPVGLAMITGQSLMNIIGSGTEKYFKRIARKLQKSIWYIIKK